MDCILKWEDTGQTAKANKTQLCPACKSTTPKGKGQKELGSKRGKTLANTNQNISYVESIFQTQHILRQNISIWEGQYITIKYWFY